MAEDSRPSEDPGDSRYFGPFGPPPGGPGQPGNDAEQTVPLGIGDWSYSTEGQPAASPKSATEDTQVLPQAPGPAYGSSSPTAYASGGAFSGPSGATSTPPSWGPSLYPAPSGVPTLRPQPSEQGYAVPGSGRGRRSIGAGALVALAALTALVVGGVAGYGGSRLAERADGGPAASSQPSQAVSAPPSAVPSAPSSPFSPAPGESNTVQVARAALPSSVMIQVGSGTSGGSGSGFVLDSQGHVMTNNHVVAAAANGGTVRVVFSDGTRTTATLVGRSPSYDLAVVKVEPSSRLKPIRIGDSDASQVGEAVIAIGSPLALPGTVTAGIVSAKNRPVVVNANENADAPSAYINAIQTDAPINPGNSGGPLIDSQARVIGVNSAILTLGGSQGQSGSIGLGFAIPINQAMEIGDLLIKKGKATYPVIGASVSSDPGNQGVELTSVEPGGPAADAGLRPGDVITKIDEQAVTEMQELIVAIRTHRPGERIQLSYQRGGTKDNAIVRLGEKEG